eukprot:TRINITY_DN5983_c0_g1_i1.p1 TRINITY_DN5983_c0_g1~~TRINITY_DN5983_c0_g1_i1.p1  ORF type:complete len:236 (+),score=75.83 TRINITY_DN5983_c0_g1_i1:41-748(+)
MITPALALVLNALLASSSQALGPPYKGDEFVKFKEVPPMEIVARNSGSITLLCSAAGNPTPSVAWFKDGVQLTSAQGTEEGLGETWAKLYLPCVNSEDAGVYECVAEAVGQQVTATTKVDVVGHPHFGCLPRGAGGRAPKVAGWFNTIMVQSGKSVRLPCHVDEKAGKVNIVWRDNAGNAISDSETLKVKGNDLVISGVTWSHMGRYTCTAQNGFGVDMVSTFVYPLAPSSFNFV